MEQEVHESTDRARAGETPHIVRYVLGISLFLAAGIMTIVWVSGALTSDSDGAGDASTSSPAQQSTVIPRQPDDLVDGTKQAPFDERGQRSTAATD